MCAYVGLFFRWLAYTNCVSFPTNTFFHRVCRVIVAYIFWMLWLYQKLKWDKMCVDCGTHAHQVESSRKAYLLVLNPFGCWFYPHILALRLRSIFQTSEPPLIFPIDIFPSFLVVQLWILQLCPFSLRPKTTGTSQKDLFTQNWRQCIGFWFCFLGVWRATQTE